MTQRSAFVLRVRPDKIDEYVEAHRNVWPEMLAALRDAGIRNYTIFRHGTDLFAYFEYVGDDFAADMAAMAADETTRRWWTLTDAMQEPLPDRGPGAWWTTIEEVFHTD
jgi:L-rhamnose mutarotase